MKRKILFIFISLFFALLQVGFLRSLEGFWKDINLILCLAVFITVIFNYRWGLIFALISGFVADLYSPFFFGLATLSLLGSVFLINLLFINFFTNKSLYSLLVLGGSGVIIYNLLMLIFSNLFFVFGLNEWRIFYDYLFLRDIFSQAIFNLVVLALLFFTIGVINRRFHSVFIWKN